MDGIIIFCLNFVNPKSGQSVIHQNVGFKPMKFFCSNVWFVFGKVLGMDLVEKDKF